MTHNTFGGIHRYPKLNPYAGLEGNIPLRYGDIYMGIEVEAENIDTRRTVIPGSFKGVADGSLKLQGMEFVTVPIKLLYLEKELERLFGSIKKASFSSRTSIHVHMNARDFTLQNLLDFLKVYTLFERNLYKYSGDRWTNNFCIPLQQAPQNLINFFSRFQNVIADTPEEAHHMAQPFTWSKYLGLNISPITGTQECPNRYGTIEFRQMIGNNNIPFIINWCNLITCIKFYVRTVGSQKLHDLIMNNNGHTIVKDVFKDWTSLVIPDENLSDIMESNSFLKYCIEVSKGLQQISVAPSDTTVEFSYAAITNSRFTLSHSGREWSSFSMESSIDESRTPIFAPHWADLIRRPAPTIRPISPYMWYTNSPVASVIQDDAETTN